MIDIKLAGPKGIQKLSELPIVVKNNMFYAMRDAGELIVRTSQEKYLTGPYPEKLSVGKTGLLRAGIWSYATQGEIGGEFGRVYIKSRAWYGKIHEQIGIRGWTEFPIFAKTAKGMTFFWERKGIWVYHAKRVAIPARPFLRPAVYDRLADVKALLQRVLRKSVEQIK